LLQTTALKSLSETHPAFGWASGPVETHLKDLGSAHGDEFEITLAALLLCAPAGRESAAKQTDNEQQIAEKHRTEAAVKTPFPHIFATDFWVFCCD
jgi:hypothetical protein